MVIQLVKGDIGKGTSGFREPRTQVLTLAGPGQVTGVPSVNSPPLLRPTVPVRELSAISRARTAAAVWRQHTTRQSKRAEI